MRIAKPSTSAATAACILLLGAASGAHAAEDRQSVEVLQDTVVNLLQALVAKGVITK